MKFDDLLHKLGAFGAYQKKLFILLSLPAIPVAIVCISNVVFLFSVPLHRCAIPDMDNDTFQVQDDYHAREINMTIPTNPSSNEANQYSKCLLYTFPNSSNVNATEECSAWVYDKSVFETTMAQSMDLVCEKRSYVSHAKMFSMVGQLLGSLISGPIADMFGRKPTIIVSFFLAVTLSFCLTWVRNFFFLVPIIITAMGCFNMAYLAAFVYGMEIVGPSKRMWTGIAMNLFWSVGNCIVTLAAFLLREWKTRQIVLTVPCLVFAYLLFLPESPRWLLSKGKVPQANSVIRKIARGNKVPLSPEDLNDITVEETREPFWELLRSRALRPRLLILLYCWFAIGMGFYGLSMNVTNLSGNIYLNFFLFVLVEACAYVACLCLLNRVGRRWMLSAAMLIAGVTCITAFIPVLVSEHPEKWVVNMLACVGNTCVSAGFAVTYLYTAELIPTSSRNFGMGLCSMVCRIGSIMSPYVSDLTIHISGRYSQIVPMLVFGGVVVVAGMIALILPETLGKKLPETIKDAEKLGNVEDKETNYDTLLKDM